MAKFSKQHYQAVANILLEAREAERVALAERERDIVMWTHHGLAVAANLFAELFQRDNSRFSREHFLAVVRGERPVNSRPPKGE